MKFAHIGKQLSETDLTFLSVDSAVPKEMGLVTN